MTPDRYLLAQMTRGIADKVVRKAIHRLRQLDPGAGILNSNLTLNFWDVVCVDIAFDETGWFPFYDCTVQQVLAELVDDLEDYERLMLWQETDEGIDWMISNQNVHAFPIMEYDEIARMLKNEHLYKEARDNPSKRAEKHYFQSL
ncbi:hypothetical protein V1T76_17405 [Roseibium sp. FZY0029]|uniref:hypothetical protein n=1 Tax=Roseibium sp. FZY0029 TaxID=3116647 RepID=UPI002ECC7B7A|nr:hypothetical protein [Roseibium sp. FZY0029]